MIRTGSDFSGVGAFDQALERLNIKQNKIFACDMDKYARQTYIYNFGEPEYYPTNVYDRKIPKTPLDIFMTSPPCQGFSIAGARKGSNLFLNSYEFIKVNKPRYFIFENVKGLLSHHKTNQDAEFGNTFKSWVNYLGGKSVNGSAVLFPSVESVPYHIYYKVLNAKNYGVPQNRERVFIVGIRDDSDNTFTWAKHEPLKKTLSDILEPEVDKKYYLSDANVKNLIKYNQRQKENNRGFSAKFRNPETVKIMDCLKVGGGATYDLIQIKSAAIRGRGENNARTLEVNSSIISNALTTVTSTALLTEQTNQITTKIRRLTPLECFRLMDFNESFKWNVSDTQAYKQAGNSIVVSCLVSIIKNLKL